MKSKSWVRQSILDKEKNLIQIWRSNFQKVWGNSRRKLYRNIIKGRKIRWACRSCRRAKHLVKNWKDLPFLVQHKTLIKTKYQQPKIKTIKACKLYLNSMFQTSTTNSQTEILKVQITKTGQHLVAEDSWTFQEMVWANIDAKLQVNIITKESSIRDIRILMWLCIRLSKIKAICKRRYMHFYSQLKAITSKIQKLTK